MSGCRKKHRKCTHGSSVEPAERRGEPSTPPPHPGRISLIVHLKVAVAQVSKNIEIRQAPDNRRHPSEETKQVENTKVLDEELRNIAHEATMKALRSKLAEAERTEKQQERHLFRRKRRGQSCPKDQRIYASRKRGTPVLS
jgi:hypothetical protein